MWSRHCKLRTECCQWKQTQRPVHGKETKEAGKGVPAR
jgi:hypothetical protein